MKRADTVKHTRYLIAGGGTGGHVFPALAVAAELAAAGAEVEFVGTERGFEAKLVPARGFVLHTLSVRGLAGKSLLDRLYGLLLVPIAVLQAYRLLGQRRPKAVLGVGGYASGPAVIAAWLRKIPVVLHEQNAMPGATNRLAARFARTIAVSFEGTREFFPAKLRARIAFTGNPVRPPFFQADPVAPKDPIRLLLFGGSQGARILNRRMTEAIPYLTGVRLGIVHQTGERDLEWVQEAYKRTAFRGAVVLPFLDDMAREIAASDLVVARAGATTVAELCASGRPALLVPFAASAGGHQEQNARALVEAGGARLILESALTGESLANALKELCADPARLQAMGEAARLGAKPDAASAVASLVRNVR